MTAVYRYEIPVDDRWHPLQLSGPILHVDCRESSTVEVWAIRTDGPTVTRSFRVFGTGQHLVPDIQHIGTAITPDRRHVWHLFETARGEASCR